MIDFQAMTRPINQASLVDGIPRERLVLMKVLGAAPLLRRWINHDAFCGLVATGVRFTVLEERF